MLTAEFWPWHSAWLLDEHMLVNEQHSLSLESNTGQGDGSSSPCPFDIPKFPLALYERSGRDPTFALIYEHPKGTACNTDNLPQQKQLPGLQIHFCLP